MTAINLLWPSWADVVAHVRKKDVVSWQAIRKAAALLANRYGREQDARFARLAWEELEAAKRPRELWARPPHRIRHVRHFLVLALAFASLAPALATAEPSLVDERDSARAATATGDGGQAEEKPGRLYQALGWAAFGAAAGDFASTELVLAEGGRELNPFMQARGVRIGASVAWAPAMNYLTEELRKDGHPKLALWMRIAVVGLKGYAIVHNLREAAR